MSMDTYDKTNTSAWPDWAALPEAYKIEDGVLYGEQNGKKIRVTSTPMYISTIADTASGAKRIEITFAKNMQQEAENVPVMLSYEDYGDPSALRTKLAHYGCNANANNIRAIMTYLDDFELLNRERIPKSRIVERFGWADDTHFCPGADTGYVRDFHAHGDFDAYVGAIHPAGSAGDWNRQMQQWRHASPVFRFILAAAFAAPLLSRLSKPNYMIHIWGLSGCGKSAAVKAALSVWGDPEKLLKSYNTTRYAATQQAYIYNDLPIGLDELGEADKLDSQKLAYSLVNGTGRQQGGKGGGVRETQSWSTVVLSTGEMGIFEDNTMDGVLNRIIELVETPFPGTAEGKAEGIRVHEFLEANYGTAGTQYITGLLACDKHKLLEIYSQFSDTLKQRYGDKLQGRYLTSLVCNAMGDYLSSQYVFGETELEALRGSMDAVYHIADGVIEARPMETNNTARHLATAPVGHQAPGGNDVSGIAIHGHGTTLLGTHPFRRPRGFHLRDPLVVFNMIAPDIGHERLHEAGAVVICLGGGTVRSLKVEGHPVILRKNHAPARMIPHGINQRAAFLFLHFIGDEFPCSHQGGFQRGAGQGDAGRRRNGLAMV